MNPFPTVPGGFSVIYADPPWKYKDKNANGNRGAAFKYPVMTLTELRAIDLISIAAPDCALFLWTTSPMMPHAIDLGLHWGFEYKTVAFSWAKRNRKKNTPFFGLGHWTRSNVEMVLLFVRGKPKRIGKDVEQFLWSPVRRHSEKPAAIRDRINRLLGDVPRIELFARHDIPGWHRWGHDLLPNA